MPEATPTDGSSGPSHDRDVRGGEPSLLQLLTRLLDGLAALRSGDPPAAGHDPGLDRWQDDDYVYLEGVLTGPSEAEIDISTHGGRVFIRVGRWE